MSFRHTYITEFLYRGGKEDELKTIEETLSKYGSVKKEFNGMPGLGYFHGVIKDSNSFDTRNEEKEIKEELSKLGVRIEIILE